MAQSLRNEIWLAYRPYAKVLVSDLLVAVSVWAMLAVFELVTRIVPVNERATQLIGLIHSVGVVAVFGVLAVSLVWDILRLKVRKGGSNL